MGNRFIGFRLRKQLDEDIYEAVKGMDGNSISELCRLGLRLALNIRTQKEMVVREVPVPAPKLYIKR